jgi:hypothetical protein
MSQILEGKYEATGAEVFTAKIKALKKALKRFMPFRGINGRRSQAHAPKHSAAIIVRTATLWPDPSPSPFPI